LAQLFETILVDHGAGDYQVFCQRAAASGTVVAARTRLKGPLSAP
jgi:hypothetical protein